MYLTRYREPRARLKFSYDNNGKASSTVVAARSENQNAVLGSFHLWHLENERRKAMILLTFLRAVREVYVEAQELRRDAQKRYPFVSDWD